MKKRKILAVTGARSEYDLLYPVYRRLQDNPQFDFSIVITGPHLSERFGYTARHIERDGFQVVDRVFNLVDTNEKIGRIISIGNQIPALAQTLDRCGPDIILVAGDREEAITATMTGAFMDIPVAHFFGGDIAKDGNIDNSIRYAASKFAHIHFPSLEVHKENLLKLGEDDWRIFVVGNPALDRFISTPILTKEELASKLGVGRLPDQYLVLIQHPIITEFDKQNEHIRITLEAIRKSGIYCFVNYPNSDPGNAPIIEAFLEYKSLFPQQFNLFQNLDRLIYINLLRRASCLLGNSSSGIIEAPSIGLPVVNIGSRQRGRIHSKNVTFVNNSGQEILDAIRKSTSDLGYIAEVKLCTNPYGDGNSASKVVQVLHDIEINERLIYKNITY